MPISRSNSRDGSSSTTMAMFCKASRNRRGMDASASATSFSNWSRCTAGFRDHGVEVVALGLHCACVAERLGPADPATVKDHRVGGTRPFRLRQRLGKLFFYSHGIVAFGDADAIADPQHM